MAKTKNFSDHVIAEAALRFAGTHGWEKLNLEGVAKLGKIPLEKINSRCAGKNDLLPMMVAYITSENLKRCDKPDKNASPRDRLFDLLMGRLETLQSHRKAILSIMKSVRQDTRIVAILFPAQNKAMKELLRFAAIPSSGTSLEWTSFGMWGVFTLALCVWKKDETIDLSKTMAVLDRYLGYGERIKHLLRPRFD